VEFLEFSDGIFIREYDRMMIVINVQVTVTFDLCQRHTDFC